MVANNFHHTQRTISNILHHKNAVCVSFDIVFFSFSFCIRDYTNTENKQMKNEKARFIIYLESTILFF